MIENNRCPKCKYVYDVSWDDTNDKYYCDDHEDYTDLEHDELYPEFCPFCGTHHLYGTEGESYDE